MEDVEEDFFADGGTRESLNSDLAQMRQLKWIDYWETLAGIGGVQVRQEGRDIAANFSDLQRDLVSRNRSLRDSLLRWVYAAEHALGSSPRLSSFLPESGANHFGSPYSDEEVDRASLWLREEDYIKGPAAMGTGVLRPSITPRGTAVVEQNRSVNDPGVGMSVTNNNVHISGSNNVNVAAGSKNVEQSVSVTQKQVQEARNLVDAFRQMAPLLQMSEDDKASAEGAVGEIEAAAHEGASAGVLKSAVTSFIGALGSAAGTGAGQALLALAQAALLGM